MVSQAVADPQQLVTPDDATPSIPTELLLRRDRILRYERDAKIYATDGRVGILNQVVVDQAAGEVTELIVTVETTGQTIVLPAQLVAKTGGSAVFLTITQAEFIREAANAPAYKKRHFRKARLRALRKRGKRAQEQHRPQAVALIGRDFVETPAASLAEETGIENGGMPAAGTSGPT